MGLWEKYSEKIVTAFETRGSFDDYNIHLDKVKEYLTGYDLINLKKYLNENLQDYDFSFLSHLLDDMIQIVSEEKDDTTNIDDKEYERLEVMCFSNRNTKAIRIDRKYSFNHVKEIVSKLYKEHSIKPFLITKSHKIAGRIVWQMYDSPRRISLIQEIVDHKSDSKFLRFIGDALGKNTPEDETSLLCYFHEFDDGHEKYILLSPERYRPQNCLVEGMVIPLMDDVVVGDSLKIGSTKKLLLANTVQLTERKLTLDEVKEIKKDWNRERLKEMFFGLYRHPPIFEDMILAWIFGGKNCGYPLHFFMLGPNASGKTWLMKSISTQLPDLAPGSFIDGANTTIKGLVPSFQGSVMSPGLFVRSYRICYVDEFLKTIPRTGANGKGIDEMTPFVSLLEHRSSIVASGNTEPTNIVATAKGMFIGNPERGLTDLIECSEKLTQPVMARFLSYNQTDEHVNYITERIAEISSFDSDSCLPKRNSDMLNLYDFCAEKPALADFKRVMDIRNKFIELVPDRLRDMYRGRYFHHINCLVDGISKTRFLSNEKDSLEYDDEDYRKAESIMWFVISSWGTKINPVDLDIWHRADYLYPKERDLYELIKKENGDLCEDDVSDKDKLKKLFDWRLIINKGGQLYSYDNEEVWGKQMRLIDL
jgi:hypothetical protein